MKQTILILLFATILRSPLCFAETQKEITSQAVEAVYRAIAAYRRMVSHPPSNERKKQIEDEICQRAKKSEPSLDLAKLNKEMCENIRNPPAIPAELARSLDLGIKEICDDLNVRPAQRSKCETFARIYLGTEVQYNSSLLKGYKCETERLALTHSK